MNTKMSAKKKIRHGDTIQSSCRGRQLGTDAWSGRPLGREHLSWDLSEKKYFRYLKPSSPSTSDDSHVQSTSSRSSFGTESCTDRQKSRAWGFEDCGKDLGFILNETGNHRKVLGREGYLEGYSSCGKGNVLDVLG